MTGPRKHTDQTPNLSRYDWKTRVVYTYLTPLLQSVFFLGGERVLAGLEVWGKMLVVLVL